MNRFQRLSRLTQEDQVFIFVREGKIDKVLEYLEEEGKSASKARWSGWTLLHRAAERGHTQLCEILLDAGAKVNARTAMGWYTPLHVCLANGMCYCAYRQLYNCLVWTPLIRCVYRLGRYGGGAGVKGG